MDHYLNVARLAEFFVGASHTSLSHRYRAGLLPDPDIYAGAAPGWGPERGALYGAFYRPSPRSRLRLPDPLPPWWEVASPVYYLSGREVAGVLGIGAGSVATYRWRDAGFVRPAVVIGADTFGWDHEEILLWGIRNEYLDEQGNVLPLRPHTRRSWR